jgi:hypothetical protein
MAKKGRIFIVAVCCVLVGWPLWAQQEKQEPIDPQEVNAESAPVVLTPGELVDQAFEEFKQKKGIQFGAEGNDGKIYYAAKTVVNKPSTSSQWAKARVNAFESALLKTQRDFIIDMFGRQSVKKAQEIFDDQSDDAEVFPELSESKSKLESIYDKLVALTGAKLDEALKKLDVDPEEFKSKPPEQRKTTFMSRMTKTMLTEAIGDSTGLMPIQTFEGNDDAGNHVMGVITMYSPKLKQLAYDIAHKRAPLLKKNTGKALKEQIPADAETLSKQFGIRVLFNENGQPCVVSFGQWSHNETGKNIRKVERRRESATESAFDEANAAIVEFLNGNIMFNREREKGEYSEEAVVKNPDGFIRREDVDKIIDKMHSNLKMQAKADLAGITTANKWMYKSPYGQELIGVVRVWTLDSTGTTNEVRKWKPDRQPGEQRSEDGAVRTTPGVKSGKDFMDVKDF